MDHPIVADSASRFEAYVEGLVSVIGHADRARARGIEALDARGDDGVINRRVEGGQNPTISKG